MLRMDVRVGDSVQIGDDVILHIERKTGQLARIAIQAPRQVQIRRVAANDNGPSAPSPQREENDTSD